MSKIPVLTHHPHNSSLALKAATLSASLNSVVALPWSDRMSFLSSMNMSLKGASFATHSGSLKCAASGDCFSKRSFWISPYHSKTLASDLPLESSVSSLYQRRVYSVSISSQRCINRHELRVCTFYYFIYLLLAVLGLCCCAGFSLVPGSLGYSSLGAPAVHCSGFSLWSTDSRACWLL